MLTIKKNYLTQKEKWAKRYEHLLPKVMSELVGEGDLILITATGLKHPVTLKIYWEEQ